MPVGMSMGGPGDARLKRLVDRVVAAGGTEARIRPTIVLDWLSDMRGKSVLGMISRAKEQAIKDVCAPRVGRALTQDHESTSASDVAIAKAWRYWAYKYIETLWAHARDGGWGTVADATLEEKRGGQAVVDRGYATGRTVAEARAKYRAQQRVQKADKGIPPESWGVRHRLPAWHAILKGRLTKGKKGSAPAQPNPKGLIDVRVKGRQIRREP